MTSRYKRAIGDTNFFVSALILPGSAPAACLKKVQRSAKLLASRETFAELTAVLLRSKFDRYSPVNQRLQALADFSSLVERIEVTDHVTECRHPKDDKFLELALSGNADLILTGDKDLLVLHPWRGVAILTPMQYLVLPAE